MLPVKQNYNPAKLNLKKCVDFLDVLSGDNKIKETLPDDVAFKNPSIIDANSTIKNGDICIENIHAVYERTGSSINDSLKGNGERVLVLNDEVHHVYNTTGDKDIRKWRQFLLNPDFNFQRTGKISLVKKTF